MGLGLDRRGGVITPRRIVEIEHAQCWRYARPSRERLSARRCCRPKPRSRGGCIPGNPLIFNGSRIPYGGVLLFYDEKSCFFTSIAQ